MRTIRLTRAQAKTVIEVIAAKAHTDLNCGDYVVSKEVTLARYIAQKMDLELPESLE